MKKAKRLLAKLLVISMIMNLFSMSSFAVPQDYEGLEPICMQTEHVHDEECYVKELSCDKAVASDSNSGTLASDSDAFDLATDSNTGHEHEDACYIKKLMCELKAHTHGEECFKVEKSEMLTLPEGASVPEGYDMAYLYVDENEQFSVTVYATKDALPEGAKLVAEILDEDSDAYAAAAEALEEMPVEEGSDEALLKLMEVESEENADSNGFVAMDIRFELDGEEVEPSESVFVCINALGLIPEEADPDSIAIQHHAENKGELEIVADDNEDTGVVEVSENTDEAALDVVTAFEVDGFSTFTITWNVATETILSIVHYVDEDGNDLELDGVNTKEIRFNADTNKNDGSSTHYDMNMYHNGINHEGYTYKESYLEIEGKKVVFTRIKYQSDTKEWAYRKNNYSSWEYLSSALFGKTLHIYLGFKKIDSTPASGYFTNPINENIKLTLYDYGSYIDYGADKAMLFGWHDRRHEGIDGPPLIHTIEGGNVNNSTQMKSSGLIAQDRPRMERTLVDGFPKLRDTELNPWGARGKSLEYLFRTDGPDLYIGSASNALALTPLDDYSNMREKATWNSTYGYNSNYESMRFVLEGDGGLFTVDEDGYYVYDSSEMSAYFEPGDDQKAGRFLLSNMLIGPGHYGPNYVETTQAFGTNFVPFDKIPFDEIEQGVAKGQVVQLPHSEDKWVYVTPFSKTEGLQEDISNMFFGMTMEIDFYVPKDGKIDGEDMVFEFSGDDDVWVYVDDVMVLDIGATHGKYDGTINFATGEIADANLGYTYSSNIRTIKSTFDEAGVSTTEGFEENGRFADYTKHTLKFFYLERGGNISYCKLRFNMPTLPEKSLTVTKELEIADANETTDMVKNALTYEFRVLQADENGNATDDLFIPAKATYTIIKEGKAVGTGKVRDDGYFTLRAGEAAQFDDMLGRADDAGYDLDDVRYVVEERLPSNTSGIYKEVEYDVFGIENTIKKEDGTTTGFTTYQTGALEADEAQIVTYRNQVETEALRHLKISKVVDGKTEPEKQDTYQIKLLVCSAGEDEEEFEPISIGTEYKVLSSSNAAAVTQKTVSKAGIIELKAGETAELRVLPGTQYKVREEVNSNYNYYDSYTIYDNEHPNGLELGQMASDEYYACGTFEQELANGANPNEEVKITNTYYLEIFKVTVNYWDKETGEKLKESYVDSRIEQFGSYDMTDKDKVAIPDYDYDSTVGKVVATNVQSDNVIDVYYTKIPEFDLIVNYYDKATGEKLATSYEEFDIRRDTDYDVSDKDDEVVIAGYKYDSTTGDALSGKMDSDKVINVYYVKKLKFDVTVNYYDKATNEKLAASYEVLELEEGTAYDVSDKDNEVVIDGYTYHSTTGDALSGTMDTDKVINVYFTKIPEPTTEAPTTEAPTTEAPTTEAPTTVAPTTEWEEDNEPETTPTTAAPTTEAPTTTVPESTVPETTVPETTAVQIVVFRNVEIPEEIMEEIREQYGDTPLEELWEMGVLGAFFEKIPTGLLPATGDFSRFWMAMSVLFGISLAVVTVLDRKRERK